MRLAGLLLIMMSLVACADTVSETQGTFVYNGRVLDSVTREFERSDGSTYFRRSVSIGPRNVTCSATDDLDCVAAIRDRNRKGNR